MIFSILAVLLILFLLFFLASLGFTMYIFKSKNEYFQEILNNIFNRSFGGMKFDSIGKSAESNLSYEEALEILNLDKGADKKAISRSYHKMMQAVHPDKGGSGYFARKLTQARDLAMKHARS